MTRQSDIIADQEAAEGGNEGEVEIVVHNSGYSTPGSPLARIVRFPSVQ
jgi:hypothetical protein